MKQYIAKGFCFITADYDYVPWLRITPRRGFRGIEMELIEHII